MRSILFLLSCLLCITASAQELYVKTFGNSKHTPVLFLHGGPGYNCANFEASTARKLAGKGFYVIVYDRRGEGRSTDPQAAFTFKQTFDDIDGIYKKYGLKKATLLGHSFGGIVATLYTQQHPDRVQAILLAGAPISLQESFRFIIRNCKSKYEAKQDSTSLMYIGMMEKMDTASLQYSSYCFVHAMRNGAYKPAVQTEEAKGIYAAFKADTAYSKYAGQMSALPTQGFWKNEHYTTLNLTGALKQLKANGTRIYGIYGQEDGLYAKEQVQALEEITGGNNLKYFDHCAHNVFMDQQTMFLEAVTAWLK